MDGKTQPHACLWWWKYWTNGSGCDCRDEGRRQSHWRDAAVFVDREIAKQDITKLHIVDTMSERKNQMIALSEVYIALPGGPGTLEEIAEVVSWVRVGQTNGICIFYNMEGYYDHLEAFFDKMVETNLLSTEDRSQIHFAKSLAEIEAIIGLV